MHIIISENEMSRFSFFFQIMFWVKYSQLPISKIQNQIIQFRIEKKKKDVSLKKGVIKEFFLKQLKNK